MASSYQDLRSFQHCRKDVDLVCFLLPEYCPLCHQSTATTESRIPPYVLPTPFCSSLNLKRSIVLKPTHGDFIRSYTRACNLHIGVTDETGQVYDFDEKGLNQRSVWSECLAVLTCNMDQAFVWDQTLDMLSHQIHLWDKKRYHENQWNCFDFVLTFLSNLDHSYQIGPAPLSKEDFCENFLVKKTKKAEQYIHLYRLASQNGCVTVPKKPP
ncbi:MKRN2 opposite strand protein [Biomphalaria pfeifferi]|uniref:MKRN2 opposite strand protein n=1 Tax=Biomphalaria pfeifferi TaxID=112525 RepID=A0AAD8FHT0_BIOPF|nr:MKRN2 opposite strand protein [Biomphalaria pfeifferi]